MIRNFLGTLVTIANDMQMSDLRTQYIQTISMDLSILTVYPVCIHNNNKHKKNELKLINY